MHQYLNSNFCIKCSKGYLTEEYSSSDNKYYYYCNNCFKYFTETDFSKTESKFIAFETLSDKEIEKIISSIFID